MTNNTLETITTLCGCGAIGAVTANIKPPWVGLLIAILSAAAYVGILAILFKIVAIVERLH